jgi:hypothetical protein
MGIRRWRRAVLGVGTLALAGVGSPVHAQVGPSAVAESVCTPENPYAVRARVDGFPPDASIAALALFSNSDSVIGYRFFTDANGEAVTGTYNAGQPFSGWARSYLDLNGNGAVDIDEPLILAATLTIANPCEGAPFAPK